MSEVKENSKKEYKRYRISLRSRDSTWRSEKTPSVFTPKIWTEVTHWAGSVLLFIYKSKTENRYFFSVQRFLFLLLNLLLFYNGICPLFLFYFPSASFICKFLLKRTGLLSPPARGAESPSCQSLGCCACVLSRVRWRRGWSRIWPMQLCQTVSAIRCCAHGCPAGCHCCPRCHWVVPANYSAPCLLAPGTAGKSCRARIGGARDLRTSTPRQMLRLPPPSPCCNAGGSKSRRRRRVQLLGGTGFVIKIYS